MDCFVIMPIGVRGTVKYEEFLKVYNYIIKETVESLGYKCTRADEIPESGMIPAQIDISLKEADLVIADLTDKNPNVMYEVGFRQALGRPLIMIAQDIAGLPFDVKQYRTIEYKPSDLESVHNCTTLLKQYIGRFIAQTETTLSSQGVESLGRDIEVGLENVYRILGEFVPRLEQTTKTVNVLSDRLETVVDESRLKNITDKLEQVLSANELVTQMNNLGLLRIYKNRPDALEDYFFDVMNGEPSAIDIVGSTIFGLKGHRSVTLESIIGLLRAKLTKPDFKLRILLTHWDFISYRQDQEKTEKNMARYVISKELKDAVDLLRENGLIDYVKFYKGSPTCFTIICDGQSQMLLNPYPYQREAYNSWCIVVEETFGGVYSGFKQAHFDEPWSNPELALPFDDSCLSELRAKLQQDQDMARQQILEQLSP
jgi:hypothetical protein